MSQQPLRDHCFLGITQSLCPECLAVVPAKIIQRSGRVYFRKLCEVHGAREDFVCSDARLFDRMEFNLPGRVPPKFAIEPKRGCPYDCGLCTEHEQHTCVAVLEITSNCNLTCPMCYASSAPGGQHVDAEVCCRAIDRLVEYEGRPEVLQLSGGEPTVHPEFIEIFEYACRQPIDIVMINTNGVRIAQDARLREKLASWRHRCEIYLQFDGLNEQACIGLRGEPLLETKLKAVELLGKLGIRTTLVCTVQAGLNLDQVGPIVRFGMERPWVTGVSLQPATYVGRSMEPDDLDERVTFPDIIQAIVAESQSIWQDDDFLPLPCAHPNAHTLAYAYREGETAVPLTRFIDVANHLDLLANGITFNRDSAQSLISDFLSRQSCGENCGCGPVQLGNFSALPIVDIADGKQTNEDRRDVQRLAESFFRRALAKDLSPADVFRVTTTSFMDAYNFDLRQLMKSCVHHLLPSGHLIPFCAYNVLYRNGHIPLPSLAHMQASLPVLAASAV